MGGSASRLNGDLIAHDVTLTDMLPSCPEGVFTANAHLVLAEVHNEKAGQSKQRSRSENPKRSACAKAKEGVILSSSDPTSCADPEVEAKGRGSYYSGSWSNSASVSPFGNVLATLEIFDSTRPHLRVVWPRVNLSGLWLISPRRFESLSLNATGSCLSRSSLIV